MVTQSDYQQWWEYHIRLARGEALTAEELTIYRAGIDTLDGEETQQLQFASLKKLRELRNQVQVLTQSLGQLSRRNEQLSHKIEEMEQTYQQLTGYSLLVDVHAPV